MLQHYVFNKTFMILNTKFWHYSFQYSKSDEHFFRMPCRESVYLFFRVKLIVIILSCCFAELSSHAYGVPYSSKSRSEYHSSISLQEKQHSQSISNDTNAYYVSPASEKLLSETNFEANYKSNFENRVNQVCKFVGLNNVDPYLLTPIQLEQIIMYVDSLKRAYMKAIENIEVYADTNLKKYNSYIKNPDIPDHKKDLATAKKNRTIVIDNARKQREELTSAFKRLFQWQEIVWDLFPLEMSTILSKTDRLHYQVYNGKPLCRPYAFFAHLQNRHDRTEELEG